MPGQRPPTLVFDLDGTLLDVSARHHHVYSAVCESLGGQPLVRAAYWQLKRQRAGWPEILALSGLDGSQVTNFEAAFAELIELPDNLGFDVLFPDTIPVLTRLAATYRCALVSLRNSATALRAQLAVFALTPFFEAIEVAPAGSDPAFQKARLIRRTVPADDPAVVIGDTEADVAAANALGYLSIAVSSGIRDKDLLARDSPGYLVDDIGGVEEALRRARLL
ncbi:MAG TPA: HAD family hydrolase [Candidatus Saccharimonadales bacterium]|nr:HAD family hydrolase [Candidatus Saccharimonadales bacterium]